MTKLTDRMAGPIELVLLPMPKGLPRGRIVCLQAGVVVGVAARPGGRDQPFAWRLDMPDPQPVPLVVEGKKHVSASGGRAGQLAGSAEGRGEGNKVPIAWTIARASLEARQLPLDGYETAWASDADAHTVVGSGKPRAKKGERAQDQALAWRDGGAPTVLDTAGRRAVATSVDGDDIGGHVLDDGQRPCLWRRGELVVLDDKALGMVHGVGDGEQVGAVAKVASGALTSRAMLWRGSSSTAVDLTPPENQSASAFACRAGLQVGVTRPLAEMPGGGAALDDQATVWAGVATDRISLHSVVPAPWNTSFSSSIAVDGDVVLVGGSVSEVAPPSQRSAVLAQRPALWRFRLRSA